MTSIEQVGARAERSVLQVMRTEAEEIARLASDFAPRDDSELDHSIKVGEDRGGINGRTRVFIYIDPEATDNKGASIVEYGLIMHEGLAPFGSGAYNLGEGSVVKDGGSGVVGGKFLERAYRKRRGEIGKKALAAARKVIG